MTFRADPRIEAAARALSAAGVVPLAAESYARSMLAAADACDAENGWVRVRLGFVPQPEERPYCLRCGVPIYQDSDGVWRRELTGVADCPRNPARDGHEPLGSVPQDAENHIVRVDLSDPALIERIEGAMRLHYLDPFYKSPDNQSRCICGGWYDGDDWDTHLAEVVVAALGENQ